MGSLGGAGFVASVAAGGAVAAQVALLLMPAKTVLNYRAGRGGGGL